MSQCATHNYAPIICCSKYPRSLPIHAIGVSCRTFSLTVQVTKYRRSYQLNVVQHLQKAAEFGYENFSRLSLTPPMVVQLTVRDMNGNSIVLQEELPFLIAHLSLFTENGMTSLDMGSLITGSAYRQGAPSPILYESSIICGPPGGHKWQHALVFFVFPDVSIRWRGRFRLGVTLIMISMSEQSFVGLLSISLCFQQGQVQQY
ncbi:hypothetical protein B0H14DRAFT_2388800 [Mycena olivaceomarginata]|nr:hypothetical protein B0H14DRAFT_2388800 [Mycena olivaceomarginata]